MYVSSVEVSINARLLYFVYQFPFKHVTKCQIQNVGKFQNMSKNTNFADVRYYDDKNLFRRVLLLT